MKRLLLLAVPLLFLACDSETSTEPSASDSEALFAKAQPATFRVECSGACVPSGDDYTITGDAVLNFDARPATKGTVTVYDCHDRSTNLWLPKEACLNRGGGGRWVLYDKYNVPSPYQTFAWLGLNTTTMGWKVKYSAQGSGYESLTVYTTTYQASP